MNRFTTILLLTLGSAQLSAAAATSTTEAARQIDDLLAKDWARNKLKPNSPASDEVFVRRIYLDVVGRIPTYRETDEFIKSQSNTKRAELIDRLLASEGYVQHYFNFWADILRAQTQPQKGGGVSGIAYTNFIKESLRTNKPYDQFVRELVSAQGNVWANGAIGYYMRDRDMPLDNMAATVRVFLGTRIECAQCHNHPFDKWSQLQFYQMAAFTYGVNSNDYNGGSMKGVRNLMNEHQTDMRQKIKAAGGKPDRALIAEQEKLRVQAKHVNEALNKVRDPLRYTTLELRERALQLPMDYKYPDANPKATVKPAVMMGKAAAKEGASMLDAYASWITSSENHRFTNVIANRLWKKHFGQGLIEPVDELMDNTLATNPELMAWLEKYMVSVNYDMKAYLRAVLNTRAYQNSVTREEVSAGVAFHFTGPLLRRLSAEQMWDSFVALINPTPDMPNLPVREEAKKRILSSKKLSDAVESLTPEELLGGAELAGEKYAEQARRLKDIQIKINKAREEGDKDKVRELSKESGILQNVGQSAVNEHVFVPALKKLAGNVSGKTAGLGDDLAGELSPAAENMMMKKGDMKMEAAMNQIQIEGYDLPKKTSDQIAAAQDEQKKVMLDEAAYFGLAEKDQKAYLQYRQQQMRTWLRSAEIDSPAPRGHYLREFGQSDRETIENANTEASVPQALAMMNSTLLPQIMEQYSQLMLTINKGASPDEKVDAAYLTLLSRKPTDKEKSVWLNAQSKGLSTIDDLIYALINTQQFIFIQ